MYVNGVHGSSRNSQRSKRFWKVCNGFLKGLSDFITRPPSGVGFLEISWEFTDTAGSRDQHHIM